MSQQLYNTLSGRKEPLQPREPNRLAVYVCGPTVYDMSHIGHARCYVAFDTIVRYLRRRYQVTFVRNFTDVDDKIIKRANEVGEAAGAVSERFIAAFHEDMALLGVAQADVEPRVTDHIEEIIQLVRSLVENGSAYEADGNVYFAVNDFAGYGKLSGRSIEDMEAGARVEVDERKRHPMDFALWKAAKPGEPSWDSPWGAGRPGWHIECSAMSGKYLGDSFDIHGGGKDLIFPHHENEIAQSEAAGHVPFARYWLHNGFVNIDNEKMSKSLGNFFTIRDVLEKFDPQTLRYYLLTTHYRSPISFSDQGLKEAEARVKYLYETLQRLQEALPADDLGEGEVRDPLVNGIIERFEAAMDDDFNTAKAIGDLSEVFRLANDILDHPADPASDARSLQRIGAAIAELGAAIGLFVESPTTVLQRMTARRQADTDIDPAKVEELITARTAARKAKEFARADQIRDQLADMGVVLKDGAGDTTWELSS